MRMAEASLTVPGEKPFLRRMPLKVVVDWDLYEANAVCMAQCPEVFRVEEDDTLTVLVAEIRVLSAGMHDRVGGLRY